MSPTELPANAAVLGAGTIGLSAGILLAAHGVPVTLITRRAQAATEAPAAIDRRLAELTDLGAFGPVQADAARSRLSARVGLPEGESFALIFEAVGEQLEHKRTVLAAAEPSLAADGVLATTTSSLPLAELASALTAPERFAGWHFFHPADLMSLVEIIPGERTDPVVLTLLQSWSERLHRRPIVLRRDVPGFVANRLQYALLREAYALVKATSARSLTSMSRSPPGSGRGGRRSVRSRRWTSLGSRSTRRSRPRCSRCSPAPPTRRPSSSRCARAARAARGPAAACSGDYSPERVRELETRRDRTLIALRDRG